METVTIGTRLYGHEGRGIWWLKRQSGTYLLTNLGRELLLVAIDRPKKGQLYLKPSGKRGVFNLLTAQNDHAVKSYMIVKVH